MFVCETAALHSLVLSMGQSLLQNGLFQRGKVIKMSSKKFVSPNRQESEEGCSKLSTKGKKYPKKLVGCAAIPLTKAADLRAKTIEGRIRAGVYAIYHVGEGPLYGGAEVFSEQGGLAYPIYVGKAGSASSSNERTGALFRRLRTHFISIRSAKNLRLRDFRVRYIELQADEIETAESALCEFFRPIWNYGIRGFGNKMPGKGRRQQLKSAWDTIHPGRGYGGRKRPVDHTAVPLQQQIEDYVAHWTTTCPAVQNIVERRMPSSGVNRQAAWWVRQCAYTVGGIQSRAESEEIAGDRSLTLKSRRFVPAVNLS
ncbi:hypothetical protein FHX16_006390 [Rhizobium sp. BK661]|nr:hypothetical protein [Rhizobium sp. BK661]